MRFVATSRPFGVRCGRTQTLPVEATGPTTHRLLPIGAAGDYVVTVAGKQDGGGDVSASFRWHTPHDGPNQPPSATVGIMVGDPPVVDSFGVILSLVALRTSPPDGKVEATATVTSSNGAALRIPLQRQIYDCFPEGYVSFTADKEVGRLAAMLGPAPFTYEVDVTMYSTRYHASATWPGDGEPGCSSCVVLHFNPPLPGL